MLAADAARRRRQSLRRHTVKEISGVIAGGQRWKFIWQETGNNGDGIVGTNDGGRPIAQN